METSIHGYPFEPRGVLLHTPIGYVTRRQLTWANQKTLPLEGWAQTAEDRRMVRHVNVSVHSPDDPRFTRLTLYIPLFYQNQGYRCKMYPPSFFLSNHWTKGRTARVMYYVYAKSWEINVDKKTIIYLSTIILFVKVYFIAKSACFFQIIFYLKHWHIL